MVLIKLKDVDLIKKHINLINITLILYKENLMNFLNLLEKIMKESPFFITIEDIIKSASSSSTSSLHVNARDVFDIKIGISIEEKIHGIKYKFNVINKDIEFSIIRMFKNEEIVLVNPVILNKSDGEILINDDELGDYIFRFSNKFSYFTSKDIDYNLDLIHHKEF